MRRIAATWPMAYAIAGAATLAAGAVTVVAYPRFERSIFMPFMVAVVAAGLIGGFGPGLVAVAVSAAFLAFVIFPPTGSLAIAAPTDIAPLAAFVAIGIGVSILVQALRTSRHNATVRELALRERIKEQRCLHAVSTALYLSEQPLPDTLRGVVMLIPAGWQWPERTHARLRFEGEEYTTDGFRPTPHRLAAPITVGGRKAGEVEVYVEPVLDELLATLPEEAVLIEAIAERIAESARSRAAENAVQRSEAFFRSIAEHAHDLITIIDADGRVRYVSPSSRRLLGHSPDERAGRSAFEFMHPDDAGRVAELLATIRDRPRAALSFEFRLRNRDGDWRTFEATGHNLLDDPGLAGIVVNARDITDRRAAEQRLRESEERFRGIFENAAVGICVTGTDGFHIACNGVFQRMVGYTEAQLRRLRFSDITHPDDIAANMRLFEEAIAGSRDAYQLEKRFTHSAGDTVWIRLTASIVRGADASPTYAIALMEDITGRKQVEDRARRTEQQLHQAQKMDAIGRLAGGIAHDFNNLLTSIRGFTELALEGLASDHAVRADLEEVRRSAERAAGLTHQLLAFSRKQVLQPRVLDLDAVISDMSRLLRRVIGEDIQLDIGTTAKLGSVRADPGQLEQVLVNLVINSRDAMPTGGRLTIRTTDYDMSSGEAARHPWDIRPGPYVALTVADSGTGMSAHTLAHAFEPFFTTKEPGKGTGLGLATVYGIVKQSGGHIWIDSRTGVGTTVRILLPRVDDAVEARLAAADSQAAPGSETILLVEDDQTLRALARRILSRQGYQVLEAANGAEALRIAATDRPIHLVLSDVVMPELGGRQLLERLRDVRPATPVLLMSGYTDDAIVRHGITEAGDLFLEKPFTADTLRRAVRQALDTAGVP